MQPVDLKILSRFEPCPVGRPASDRGRLYGKRVQLETSDNTGTSERV